MAPSTTIKRAEEQPLPPLTEFEFRKYNRLAERMDAVVGSPPAFYEYKLIDPCPSAQHVSPFMAHHGESMSREQKAIRHVHGPVLVSRHAILHSATKSSRR